MSTATATRSNTPTGGTPLAQTEQQSAAPKSNAGYERRIKEYAEANGIALSKKKVKTLSGKIAWIAAAMQEQFDFYEALRILGMTTDTTARQAEHRATCRKLECDTCGRRLP